MSKRIRRYGTISHDIFNDPEVQELGHQGAYTVYAWIEMCLWADRTEGFLKGSLESISRSISGRLLGMVAARPGPRTITKLHQQCITAASWAHQRGWIVNENGGFRLAKYAEYHRTRTPISAPPTDRPTDRPIKRDKNLSNKRTTQLPERNIYLNDNTREWARSKGFRKPDDLVEKFEEDAKAKGKKFIDWYSAFQTWIRNDAEWHPIPEDPYAKYEDRP